MGGPKLALQVPPVFVSNPTVEFIYLFFQGEKNTGMDWKQSSLFQSEIVDTKVLFFVMLWWITKMCSCNHWNNLYTVQLYVYYLHPLHYLEINLSKTLQIWTSKKKQNHLNLHNHIKKKTNLHDKALSLSSILKCVPPLRYHICIAVHINIYILILQPNPYMF